MTAAESCSLETILGNKEAFAEFFDCVWQKSCGVFRRRSTRSSDNKKAQGDPHASMTTTSSSWKDDKVFQSPYEELVENGWNVLINLLEEGERVNDNNNNKNNENSHITTPDEHATLPCSPYAAVSTPSPSAPLPPPSSSFRSSSYQQQEKPLLFKNQNPLTLQEQEIHGGSLFSAYLDGCSIVINHADLMSSWIAALCNDLQNSFPHVYANTYLTPPNCQTVPPHADDRDVFVIQIYGSKQWTVYKNIPIPCPYPNEQVGKGQLPVPDQVLHDPVLIQQTLNAGDVLYMPRGYVHEAQSVPDELSFHVTVALATHDWSLAGIFSSATDQVVKSLVDYRMALPRQFGRGTWDDENDDDNHGNATTTTTTRAINSGSDNSSNNDNIGGMRISINDQQALQQQIDQAINMVREKFTARFVHEHLKLKFQRHNERARVGRHEVLERTKQQEQKHEQQLLLQNAGGSSLLQPLVAVVVGLEAAKRVNLHTRLRAATVDEKQQAQVAAAQCNNQNRAVGLHVREDIANDIISILQCLKSGVVGCDNTATSCCCCSVGDLRSLLLLKSPPTAADQNATEMTAEAARAVNPLICDLSLLCFARKCVEFGALAIIDQDEFMMKE